MSVTIKATIGLGARFVSGDSFFSLAAVNQGDFKKAFAADLEDADYGIPAPVRDNWVDLPYTADVNGHIAEATLAGYLNTVVSGYVAPRATFSVTTGNPIEVVYIWIGGKRICYHKYAVKRAKDGGASVDWKVERTYGSVTVTAQVTADFWWPTTY